jgi:hypothetical protein
MPGLPLPSRAINHFVKTITFDGTSVGDVGTDLIGTVTGRILIESMSAFCPTLLAGATATIELGTANNTAALIALTTATELDANEFWRDTTPEAEVSAAITGQNVASNILLTVATAAVTAGVIEFAFYWRPMSVNGNLA